MKLEELILKLKEIEKKHKGLDALADANDLPLNTVFPSRLQIVDAEYDQGPPERCLIKLGLDRK